MDRDTRNAIERATQRARTILEDDFAAQLEGDFDVHRSGTVAPKAGAHLSAREVFQREKIIATIEHKRAAGMDAPQAVADYVRDAAFTTLNRFVALKMLEARELLQECITKGEQSSGYREFSGLAPGLLLLPDSEGYRIYIESLFDELSTEVKVLFDRRDPVSALWPKRPAFEQLLEVLNSAELKDVWGVDETIGWVYQFFNAKEERTAMRDPEQGGSQTPRNSRELAIRNQFFTPRYVVQFLTDNTLGRIWYEMCGSKTGLSKRCEYMVRKPSEEFTQRQKKDPRDIRVLDPACGSGHFLLYAFDLLLTIYEEAYADPDSPQSDATDGTLAADYPSLDALRKAIPGLILAHNLHGVNIDPRCAQIAQLALWMRAQRAYRDLGIDRADRSQIRRSKVVIAEPLIADDRIVADFVTRLDDVVLGRVFTDLVEKLKLAGDLGVLLRVESIITQQTNVGQMDLLAPPEEQIRDTLSRFVADEEDGSDTRRRLFADDTVNGLGLLEISEQRFDVLLMNPPFGAITDHAADYLTQQDCGNLYSAFVRRAVELGTEAIGCITDRTFLTQASFMSFRRELLTGEIALDTLCDLGWGVLDANVQTTAYVLLKGSQDIAFLDLRDAADKSTELARSGRWKWVSTKAFVNLPDSLLAYALPSVVLRRVSEWKSLSELASLPRGLGSNKAIRTYLAWVEIPQSTETERRWEPLSNGGEFSPWWREDRGVADWRMPNGRLWISMNSSDNWRPYDQSGSADYFRAGLSFPKQSASFNAAVLPRGLIPTREGKAILPQKDENIFYLLAYLNSGVVRAFVRDTCGLHKQSGSIGRIPVPDFSATEKDQLERIGKIIAGAARHSYTLDETSLSFIGPAPLVSIRKWHLSGSDVNILLSELDALVYGMFGLGSEDASWPESAAEPSFYLPTAKDTISWAVGVAFGRFSEHAGERTDHVDDLLAQMAPRSPAMKIAANAVLPESAIFVDDAGHPEDLAERVGEVLGRAGAAFELAPPENHVDGFLATFLRSDFFEDHLERYRIARRRAPIYWQLATPSAGYSVWLYIQGFTKDTMFRVQNDYVGRKLAHEERRLDAMALELGDKATASERETLATQETFVEELRTFLDEVKRVAPLWDPNLDDGVIINFAPLWRLVPRHRQWQREVKSTWDALCDGKYDWTHLAMRLWPERVVPKCAVDRSLAIAHGLEEVFWMQRADGRWKRREIPTRSVMELVLERTSPAVKAALTSLLEAPAMNGGSRARGGRRRAAGTGIGGSR